MAQQSYYQYQKNFPYNLSNVLNDAKELGLPGDRLLICENNGDYYYLIPNGSVHYCTLDGYSDESWKNLADQVEQVWIEETKPLKIQGKNDV